MFNDKLNGFKYGSTSISVLLVKVGKCKLLRVELNNGNIVEHIAIFFFVIYHNRSKGVIWFIDNSIMFILTY